MAFEAGSEFWRKKSLRMSEDLAAGELAMLVAALF